jgi:peptide/nickel transport system permease protein
VNLRARPAPEIAARGEGEPDAAALARAARRLQPRRIARWAVRRWSLLVGLGAVALLCLMALGAGVISPYAPDRQNMAATLQPPSRPHPLGTDEYGRDLLSRVFFGARLTLLASSAAVLLAAVVGSTVGLTAGYFGGAYDSITGRATDILFAFPVVLLGIAMVTVLGPGESSVVVAIATASLPNFARVSRSAILRERELEYVVAAHAVGASTPYIILRTLLPNLIGPLTVLVSLGFAYAVLYEASLSFLGLGAQPPTPEWGVMLSSARDYLFQAPWYAFFPGFSIVVLVFSLNLVGDGLRDLLDPYRHNR